MKEFNQVRRGVVDKGIHFRAGGCRFERWWVMSKRNYMKKVGDYGSRSLVRERERNTLSARGI